MTVLSNELFITRHFKSSVEVYDSISFVLTRSFMIPDTDSLNVLIACPTKNCLYITDFSVQNVIHRYDLSSNLSTKWTVGGKCSGLSLTNTGNILVTLFNDNRVQEYTTQGKLARDIYLDRSIVYPLHCIQMSTGHLVVCHYRTMHRICIVNSYGDIVHSYGGPPGSDIEQLNVPAFLAVDAKDCVYVADRYNNRVVLLSPTLTRLGVICPMLSGHKLNQPCSLYLHERSGRLYVGEEYNGRLFVLKTEGSVIL